MKYLIIKGVLFFTCFYSITQATVPSNTDTGLNNSSVLADTLAQKKQEAAVMPTREVSNSKSTHSKKSSTSKSNLIDKSKK